MTREQHRGDIPFAAKSRASVGRATVAGVVREGIDQRAISKEATDEPVVATVTAVVDVAACCISTSTGVTETSVNTFVDIGKRLELTHHHRWWGRERRR